MDDLRPTEAQYEAFGEYLCRAHSWYKHLPLLTGRSFVVFVSRDAGIGCLVAVPNSSEIDNATSFDLVTPAEGPEFTEEHPRLHYGWRTTKEYRTRFGYLDYMFRTSPEEPYMRDAGEPPFLAPEIEKRCSFVLYPYVSGTFIEAVKWHIHADALSALRAGIDHPAREELLELSRLAEEQHIIAQTFTATDMELAIQHNRDHGTELLGELPLTVRKFLEQKKRAREAYVKLWTKEDVKIKAALAALDSYLRHR